MVHSADRAVTHDVTRAVDSARLLQDPAGVGRNEIVEIAHRSGHPQERARIFRRILRSADDRAGVVDAVRARLDAAREHAEVAHSADFVEDECVGHVRRVHRVTGDLSRGVDCGRERIVCAERAEGNQRVARVGAEGARAAADPARVADDRARVVDREGGARRGNIRAGQRAEQRHRAAGNLEAERAAAGVRVAGDHARRIHRLRENRITRGDGAEVRERGAIPHESAFDARAVLRVAEKFVVRAEREAAIFRAAEGARVRDAKPIAPAPRARARGIRLRVAGDDAVVVDGGRVSRRAIQCAEVGDVVSLRVQRGGRQRGGECGEEEFFHGADARRLRVNRATGFRSIVPLFRRPANDNADRF